jgi:hypothetical protein
MVEQLGGQGAVEGMARDLIGEFGWIFVAGVAVLMFRELVQNFAAGLKVYFSKQWALDEIVFLNGRQARIVRIGMTETVFYMSDRKSTMRIENTSLSTLICEKILTNHQPDYLPKGSESSGPLQVEVMPPKKPVRAKRK